MANNLLSSSSLQLTALIIAKNEEKMIANCIETVRWCNEVLVLDNGSTDATAELAEELGARVIHYQTDNFATLRQEILKHAKTEWVFYLDADERVTPSLAQEIRVQLETSQATAFSLKRQNYFYGQEFKYTGTQTDTVTRIFKRKALSSWQGKIHESPVYTGETHLLQHPLLHFTHRTTREGLLKSADWTYKEAELLAESLKNPVSVTTILRKGIMELFRRAIRDGGYKDGTAGWVEAIIQGMNRMMVYIQVWELQRNPSIAKRYEQLEEEVAQQWRKAEL